MSFLGADPSNSHVRLWKATFLLKDVPMIQQVSEVPDETETVAGSEEGMPVIS